MESHPHLNVLLGRQYPCIWSATRSYTNTIAYPPGGHFPLSKKPVSHQKTSHSLPLGVQIWVTFPIKGFKIKKVQKFSRRLQRQGFCVSNLWVGPPAPIPVSHFRKTSHPPPREGYAQDKAMIWLCPSSHSSPLPSPSHVEPGDVTIKSTNTGRGFYPGN